MPAPAAHEIAAGSAYKVDPYLFGRETGAAAYHIDYVDSLAELSAVQLILLPPQLAPPAPVEGLRFAAPGGGYYLPEHLERAVDELIGREPGHRSWVATWARHGRVWLRLFRAGLEHGWCRAVDEDER